MPNPHWRPAARIASLIPKPAFIRESEGNFVISPNTKIVAQRGNSEIAFIANLLSTSLGEVSGYEVPVVEQINDQGPAAIWLSLIADESLGKEGYELSLTTDGVRIESKYPAGLFYGVQTLRQLLESNLLGP